MVLEKTLESPLDCKEIQPVHSKGDQSWVFIGRTDAGRDWGQEEKGTTEDEMAGWHHQLNGCEFEQAPGDGEGQGSLVCCSPWGRKELDRTEQLNSDNVPVDVDLLAEVSGCPSVKLLFRLPSVSSVLFGRNRYEHPTFKGWALGYISLTANVYIYILEFLCMGALTLLPHYIIFPCKIFSVFCLKLFIIKWWKQNNSPEGKL